MKTNYIISQDRLNNLIEKYLDKNFSPDYKWGQELHDFYRKDVNTFGSYSFTINDVVSYIYLKREPQTRAIRDKLTILPRVSDRLRDYFGEMWIPVFQKWFEKNSGLKVKEMLII